MIDCIIDSCVSTWEKSCEQRFYLFIGKQLLILFVCCELTLTALVSLPRQCDGASYPPMSVAGKVQTNLLHTGDQRLIRRLFLRFVVICSFGQFHQFAPPFNSLDEGAVLGNELCFFSAFLRLLSTAFFKNSFSSVTLPKSLSSSRTRASRSATFHSSARLPGSSRSPRCWMVCFPRYTPSRPS